MNTRLLILIILIASPLAMWAQEHSVQLKCTLTDCTGPIKLFRFSGLQFETLEEAQPGPEGAYQFELSLASSEPQFFYLGPNAKLVAPVLLGPEPEVSMEGSCRNLRNAVVRGSELNRRYQEVRSKISYFKVQYNRNAQLIKRSPTDEREALLDRIRELDEEQLAYLDSLREADPFMAGIMSLNTYLSFEHNKGNYPNGLAYFANEHFRYADFSLPGLDASPWVFESFRNYVRTLATYKLPDEQIQQAVTVNMQKIPVASPARQLAMGGVLTALKERNHPSYPVFAQAYIKEFKSRDPAGVAMLEGEMEKIKALMVGGEAPDFSQKTPEGEELALSDLRGQVVLLDFWASWCGPCRRENPNVKKLYERYKDEGFTVLGVSLDKDRNRWLAAIEKDGLDWHHVSDLRGWSNAVAKQYDVHSIPHTLLLDREGKIIGVKLRGPQLEKKLEEVFGTP